MKHSLLPLIVRGLVPLCMMLLLGCGGRSPDATAPAETGTPEATAPEPSGSDEQPETDVPSEKPPDANVVTTPDPVAPTADRTPATPDISQTNYYEIRTSMGTMVIRLFDETPGHRDNFRKLVEDQFYDSTLFHRTIQGFMIQGGDPNSLDNDPLNDGRGGPGYTLPGEFRPYRYHVRGVLSAARRGDATNRQRESSGSQFYIVQGRPFTEDDLAPIEQGLRRQIPDSTFAFPDSIRALYTTIGGAPNLDGMYTVFGELVSGYDVLDSISGSPTPRNTGRAGSVAPQLIDYPYQPVLMIIRPLPNYQQ